MNILFTCIVVYWAVVAYSVQENVIEIYEIANNNNLTDMQCKSINSVSYENQRIVSLKNNTLVLQNGSSLLVLQLLQETQFCDRKLRLTNNSGIMVAIKESKIVATENSVLKYDSNRYHEDKNKENPDEYVIRIVEELNQLKEENAQLKHNLNSVQYQLQLNNAELHRLSALVDRMYPQKGRRERSIEDPQDDGFSFLEPVCKNFLIFPCENILLEVIMFFYVAFSVINTLMNYSSLRMLQNKRDRCIVFYCLTQGLTTRYICRTQSGTKKKVDKWLLDIETPLK